MDFVDVNVLKFDKDKRDLVCAKCPLKLVLMNRDHRPLNFELIGATRSKPSTAKYMAFDCHFRLDILASAFPPRICWGVKPPNVIGARSRIDSWAIRCNKSRRLSGCELRVPDSIPLTLIWGPAPDPGPGPGPGVVLGLLGGAGTNCSHGCLLNKQGGNTHTLLFVTDRHLAELQSRGCWLCNGMVAATSPGYMANCWHSGESCNYFICRPDSAGEYNNFILWLHTSGKSRRHKLSWRNDLLSKSIT